MALVHARSPLVLLQVRSVALRGISRLSLRRAPTPATQPSSRRRVTRAAPPARVSSLHVRAKLDMAGEAQASQKLAKLREGLKGRGVDAFIVPSDDPHMSEYAPTFLARREYISGFTGSAGTVVVTQSEALLWTDGRYFLQAENQLGSEWTLMRQGTKGCPEVADWLAEKLPQGARVGVDPFVHTVTAVRQLSTKLAARGGEVVPVEENPVDAVWDADTASPRPAPPTAPVRVQSVEYAGVSAADKLARLRKDMAGAGAGCLLVTALDEVAWVLNLRGNDVAYNPVFIAYLAVLSEGALLFIDAGKVTDEAAAELRSAGVEVRAYESLLEAVGEQAGGKGKLWLDPGKVSYAIFLKARAALDPEAASPASPRGSRKRPRKAEGAAAPAASSKRPEDAAPPQLLETASPVAAAKAVKNEAELAGMREAHLRDAVALARAFSGLEARVSRGEAVSEVEVDAAVVGARRAQPGFIEPSFPTIAGAGPNGAVIHYRAEEGTCRHADGSTLLLVDSGGQYDCGTTDVTRTFHLGEPTEHQRHCFTRVLQGHIALDAAVFPEDTPGLLLDTLARRPLWEAGLDYRHGTGHGVGAALNVHEGPLSISPRLYITHPLAAGMVVSNEPGYYEDGAFGVRIENVMEVVEAPTPYRFGGKSYLGFKRMTFCPIQLKMIATELLTAAEKAWVNAYHAEVLERVAPRLEKDEKALEWLKANAQPIPA